MCTEFDPNEAATAKALTIDEARRIAANITKLPKLLGKGKIRTPQ